MIGDRYRQIARGRALDNKVPPSWKDEAQFIRVVSDYVALAAVGVRPLVVRKVNQINPALCDVPTCGNELYCGCCRLKSQHAATRRRDLDTHAGIPATKIFLIPKIKYVDSGRVWKSEFIPN